MTRLAWFPFDVTAWRDVSDALTEVERGVCIEVYAVFWGAQPTAQIEMSAEAWASRLRLRKSAAKSLPAILAAVESRGLLRCSVRESAITVAVPQLAEDFEKRARDSSRHTKADDGTFRPGAQERSRPPAPVVPSSTSGTFQAPPSDGSRRQDSTDRQDREDRDAPSSTAGASTAAPPSAKSRVARPLNPKWEDATKVLAHYVASGHPDYRPDRTGHLLVIQRFGDGYTVEALCDAIEGVRYSEFHAADPGRQTVKIVFGTSDQVAKFIALKKASEKLPLPPTSSIDTPSPAARNPFNTPGMRNPVAHEEHEQHDEIEELEGREAPPFGHDGEVGTSRA